MKKNQEKKSNKKSILKIVLEKLGNLAIRPDIPPLSDNPYHLNEDIRYRHWLDVQRARGFERLQLL